MSPFTTPWFFILCARATAFPLPVPSVRSFQATYVFYGDDGSSDGDDLHHAKIKAPSTGKKNQKAPTSAFAVATSAVPTAVAAAASSPKTSDARVTQLSLDVADAASAVSKALAIDAIDKRLADVVPSSASGASASQAKAAAVAAATTGSASGLGVNGLKSTKRETSAPAPGSDAPPSATKAKFPEERQDSFGYTEEDADKSLDLESTRDDSEGDGTGSGAVGVSDGEEEGGKGKRGRKRGRSEDRDDIDESDQRGVEDRDGKNGERDSGTRVVNRIGAAVGGHGADGRAAAAVERTAANGGVSTSVRRGSRVKKSIAYLGDSDGDDDDDAVRGSNVVGLASCLT